MPDRGPRVMVPVVQRWVGERIDVRLYEAVAAMQAPPAALYLPDVGPVSDLCGFVTTGRLTKLGEVPHEAYLVARRPEYGRRRIRGRSAALGLALASLAHFEGLALKGDVVATGNLLPQKDGDGMIVAVTGVDYLEHKLHRALRDLATKPRTGARPMVIFPADHDLDRETMGRLLEEARMAGVDVAPVRHLVEAAELVFERPPGGVGFKQGEIARLRWRLRELMEDQSRSVELVEVACKLWDMVSNVPRRGVGMIARYDALTAAFFASRFVQKVARERGCRLPGARPDADLTELRARLVREVEDLEGDGAFPKESAWEMMARWRNVKAIHKLTGNAFEEGADIAKSGLDLPGLGHQPIGERRRLKATRAQLLWRAALRMQALGMEPRAATMMEEALDLTGQALEDAREAGDAVKEENDRARVKVYRVNGILAARVLLPDLWPELEPEADYLLVELLGHLHPEGSGLPPQNPAWALQMLWRWWAMEGRWAEVVTHYRDLEHEPFTDDQTLAQVLLGSGERALTCLPRIAGLVAEAAVRTGDVDLALRLAEVYPDPANLEHFVRWWPLVAVAEPGGRLHERLTRLPVGLRETEDCSFVRRHMEAMTGPRQDRGARDLLLGWLGIPVLGDTPA